MNESQKASAPLTELTRPPRPALAFRVGVVGHRPNRLQEADLNILAGVVRDLLAAIKETVHKFHIVHHELFAGRPPVCRAVTPLAEGSDRLFAEQALELGFILCCPLPFHRDEYEKDFAEGKALENESVGRFRSLLRRTNTIFELDGSRIDEGAAYGAAGRVVLNQSDLLIVIRDGRRLGKAGGTEEVFEEARMRGVPVLWIDAVRPHAWQLLDPFTPLPSLLNGERAHPIGGGAGELAALTKLVWSALDFPKRTETTDNAAKPPESENEPSPSEGFKEFLGERKPRTNPAVFWRGFRDLVGDGRLKLPPLRVKDFEKDVEGEWPRDTTTVVKRVMDRLRPYYAWPDKLAVVYSDTYRSAFILAYLLAAAAVCLALLPVAAGWFVKEHHIGETICILAEFFTIMAILAIIARGRRCRWHERWINYRLAAEMIRPLRLVVPLGGTRPYAQLPAHLSTYGHPGATWMAWYVRALERDLGLPTALLNKNHLDECCSNLTELLKAQIGYHEATKNRCHRIEHRLHFVGLWLLGLTTLACGLHVLPSLVSTVTYPHEAAWSLIFLCGFFPALGAALAGINNQGEFRRIVKRSEAMVVQLNELLENAIRLQSEIANPVEMKGPPDSVRLAALGNAVALTMINEVLDWRVVFLDRPLNPPA